MAAIFRSTSLKSALIISALLLTSLALFLQLIFSSIIQLQQQQQQVYSKLTIIANITALHVTDYMLANNRAALELHLSALRHEPSIKNIHIYKWSGAATGSEFIASYNNNDTGPWPRQDENLLALSGKKEPNITNNSLEWVRPIQHDGSIIGFVYLRASLEPLQQQQRRQLLINIILMLLALGLTLLLAVKLQHYFSRPVLKLQQLIQQVAKDKNYQLRAPNLYLTELNQLSRAFNTLLDRIEQQLQKNEQTELEIKQLNQNLELTIAERTQALRAANQELLDTLATLHQYQQQIVETEKMASLGQMVAGIAHEVNTPIGLGVTASTLLQDKLTDIESAFEQKALTASQLARFLAESKENLNIIYRNLERAAGLISSFKQVAVDQSHESMREVSIQQLINEVLLSLRPNIKKTLHHIRVDCPEDLVIFSKPGPLNQILINLIMNSLQHAFPDGVAGEIMIKAYTEQGRFILLYQDNGQGVPEPIRKRIFDPFVTSKRGQGGSGLGLHLVYNLVTQALKGQIKLETTLGAGVQVTMSFPLKSLSNSSA